MNHRRRKSISLKMIQRKHTLRLWTRIMGNLKTYYNNIPYNQEGREITECVKHGYG